MITEGLTHLTSAQKESAVVLSDINAQDPADLLPDFSEKISSPLPDFLSDMPCTPISVPDFPSLDFNRQSLDTPLIDFSTFSPVENRDSQSAHPITLFAQPKSAKDNSGKRVGQNPSLGP